MVIVAHHAGSGGWLFERRTIDCAGTESGLVGSGIMPEPPPAEVLPSLNGPGAANLYGAVLFEPNWFAKLSCFEQGSAWSIR